VTFHIRQITSLTAQKALDELSEALIECVASGGSISFMHPVTKDAAQTFWRGIANGVERGEHTLLVAEDVRGQIVGTVQIVLSQPENQPHRADVAKLLVHPRARRQGIAEALMREIERVGKVAGKSLLTLDTETGAAAERLYKRLGWTVCGTIPNYALLPHGGYCSTTIFYKPI
jgi:ribosomal protein S18 acetylase RimI-like enzyme